MQSRRDALRTFGLGVVTGATGLFAYSEEVVRGEARENGFREGWNEVISRTGGFEPTTNDKKVYTTSQDDTLSSGEHDHVSFSIKDNEALLEVVGISDDHLDWIAMTKEDYSEYSGDSGDSQHLILYSRLDTTRAVVQRGINPGDYEFVVDNTDTGETAASNNPIEYVVDINVYQRENEGYRGTPT